MRAPLASVTKESSVYPKHQRTPITDFIYIAEHPKLDHNEHPLLAPSLFLCSPLSSSSSAVATINHGAIPALPLYSFNGGDSGGESISIPIVFPIFAGAAKVASISDV